MVTMRDFGRGGDLACRHSPDLRMEVSLEGHKLVLLRCVHCDALTVEGASTWCFPSQCSTPIEVGQGLCSLAIQALEARRAEERRWQMIDADDDPNIWTPMGLEPY